MEPKPTIGRIVHYRMPSLTKPEEFTHIDECEWNRPAPAIVIETYVSGACLIRVFDRFGAFAVQIKVPYSEEPKPGHWSWPPRV